MAVSQSVGQSPFVPVTSFIALACGAERITLKDPAMLELQAAIHAAGHCRDALVSARAAKVEGGDPAPFIADAIARFRDQASALGFFIDPIDDVARVAVEGERIAAE